MAMHGYVCLTAGWRRAAVLLACTAWVCCAAVYAQAPVALVTEAHGLAETRAGEATVHVTPLSEFAAGSRVRLKKDARLTVLFYDSGELYSLIGPSLVRFTSSSVEALSGNEPKRMPSLVGRDGKPLLLRPLAVTQAGAVARGVAHPIPALTPAGSAILETRPRFAWREVRPELSYRFVLRDAAEKIIAEADVTGGTYELPATLKLATGERYRWTLRAKSADGTEYALNHRFRVADAALRAAVANFQPDEGAGAAQRVAFAVWLEQAGLADEARRYWRELAQQGVGVPSDRAGPP